MLDSIAPFFIVKDVSETIAFYRDHLGFDTRYQHPQPNPFFAILGRNSVQIFVKAEQGVAPVPNNTRHAHLRWDAYVYIPDPDALANEFIRRGAPITTPLDDTHDGLRGFEVTDPNGYVLFFGRPR